MSRMTSPVDAARNVRPAVSAEPTQDFTGARTHAVKPVFTIDVEDWFHILDLPSTPKLTQWDALPSRIERNFRRLLDILSEYEAKATCFFLGWVAQQFPHLVAEAARQGHEIASHGFAHQLVFQMTPEEFYQDAVRSKRKLEDITGQAILGYRSAGFSVVEGTPWFFEKLIEAGYAYDSSVFPGPRGHGGMASANPKPHVLTARNGTIVEFPMTVTQVLGRPLCFSGGGYLRLFPYALVKRWTNQALQEDRAVVFYVHPREIDPEHPRLPMNLHRRFKSYVNLRSTEKKIRHLLTDFEVVRFQDVLGSTRERASEEREGRGARALEHWQEGEKVQP